jgi:ribosomal protein L3
MPGLVRIHASAVVRGRGFVGGVRKVGGAIDRPSTGGVRSYRRRPESPGYTKMSTIKLLILTVPTAGHEIMVNVT